MASESDRNLIDGSTDKDQYMKLVIALKGNTYRHLWYSNINLTIN